MDSLVWTPINTPDLDKLDHLVQTHHNKALFIGMRSKSQWGRRLILVRRLSDGTYTETRVPCPLVPKEQRCSTAAWQGRALAIVPGDRYHESPHTKIPLPKAMHMLHPDTLEWEHVPLPSDPPETCCALYHTHYVVNDTWHMLGRALSVESERAWIRLHIPTRTWLPPLPAMHMYDSACTYGDTAYLINYTSHTLETYTRESGFSTISGLPYTHGNDYTKCITAYERHVVITVVVHGDDTDEVVGEQYYCLSLVSGDWKKIPNSTDPGIDSGIDSGLDYGYDPVIEWDADFDNASVSSVYMSGCVPRPWNPYPDTL
ncbi:hypothetical protein KIPB_007829 [Kipferlia bialata]|uniref:Uncharacterized protein n=1 Tax=Kipferlia bialata TaxID=797122 RepID=A0A9K3GKC9_9EUKA|nr:hypothetical protein KIPB_007829 [Kipferlia bialata]|eukprot:g7829.t1